MKKKIQEALASYARAALVAIGVTITAGKTQPKEIAAAAIIAIIAPAIRAMNPKDRAFGIAADEVSIEIDKLLKAEKPAKK